MIAATFCGAIESRCSFIIKDSLSTGSCTEWYVRCKELNLAWMDSAPCSLRRPNPTYVLFAHDTVFSSSMCIFNVIEQSGKELLKCSMSWAIIVSIGLCIQLFHTCTCTCMHVKSIPSSSSMKLLSYIRWHWPSRVKMFVNFMHASVAGVISVGLSCCNLYDGGAQTLDVCWLNSV